MSTYDDVMTGLQHIAQVRQDLPEELNKMTERLNEIQENLVNIITENQQKQLEVIQVLLEVKDELQQFPQIIATQQSLLQNKMIAVAGKIKQLNDNMVEQREELTNPVEMLTDYFNRFEEQLDTMKNTHLQLLAQGINTFNQLWENLESNHEAIDIAWQSTEQEIQI